MSEDHAKLSEPEIRAALSADWTIGADMIQTTFVFKDFNEAWAFMTKVAQAAEQADHHPEWCNIYNRVTIKLSTHEAGGVTTKDVQLARAIDQLK